MATLRWWLVLGLVACGGDGTKTSDSGTTGDDDDDDITTDAPVCDEVFTPCGGDPVGSWTVTGVCEVSVDELSGCDGLEYRILDDRSSGTVEMNADDTYDRTYNIDMDFEIDIPLSCISPIPCNLLATASGGVLDSCTDDGVTCTCAGSYADVDSASGTYAVDGNTLVFDGSDRQDYCVRGNGATVLDSTGVRTLWVK